MAAAKKKEKKPIQTGASSRHITNLKQSILETLDIYGASIVGNKKSRFLLHSSWAKMTSPRVIGRKLIALVCPLTEELLTYIYTIIEYYAVYKGGSTV